MTIVGARPRRLLIVEDDPEITRLLELHLRDAGWDVDVAADGKIGLARVTSRAYDAVVLDLMLPHVDGFTICKAVRQQALYTPVVMLTARCEEVDRILGLEIGADDYLIKPFSIRELVARLRALFRRLDAYTAQFAQTPRQLVQVLDLTIDARKRRVERSGRVIQLTPKEFDLLLFLARHPGHVYTRTQLLEDVWGYGYEGYGHAVNTHINRLRAKIEDDAAHPQFVLTVWGVGYTFYDAATAS